ncbi:MAG: hypothetical protein ABJH45_12305 [Paracoccaceae bacterium]
MHFNLRFSAAILLSIGATFPASAVSVTFNVEVTESILVLPAGPNPPLAELPALGTLGTVTISLPGIDASNTTPFSAAEAPPNAGSVSASVTVGSLSASLDPGVGAITFATDTLISFANGSFAAIDVDFPLAPLAAATYAGGFRLVTPADGVTPTTFGDVAAALTDPTTSLFFSFNGTTFGNTTSFRADSIGTVPPVPLPGGAILLGTAILGSAAFRRRRSPKKV